MNDTRTYMAAHRDGRVAAVVRMLPSDVYAVIVDGDVTERDLIDADEGLATLRVAGFRKSVNRASAEALLAGNDARCKQLADSMQRCLTAIDEV